MRMELERMTRVTQVPATGPSLRSGVSVALLSAAAAGWWWSVRMATDMTDMDPAMAGMTMGQMLSFSGFVLAWLAMMAAMMLPAILPVLRLYALAAAHGRVAPLPFFTVAYLVVWTLPAIPAYSVWRWLETPLLQGAPWAARLAGGVLIVAAIWQLTPLKVACLRHCRSPLSFFMQYGSGAARPLGAFRMGAAHGLFCLGCCWALMAVLVALGTMNLAWMLALSVLIFLEKNAPGGERVAAFGAVVFALAGMALLFDPGLLIQLN
jgi:predicted metal-binding membrane protein